MKKTEVANMDNMDKEVIIFIDTDTISEEELMRGDSYTGGEIYMGEDEEESSEDSNK